MPTYEFLCLTCHHTFERQLAIGARNDPQTCPACGAEKVARVASAPGFSVHGYAAKNGYCHRSSTGG